LTEEEARAWVRQHFGVSRETALDAYAQLLRTGAQVQNLIAASTVETLWARHLVDSAQLVPLAADAGRGAWIDIGSGAGLPGVVAGILTHRPIILVEPRRKRVEFLRYVIDELGLGARVSVQPGLVEAYRPTNRAAIISARAVSALPQLVASAAHCTDSSTVWLLPKGRNAQSEVEAAQARWQGVFHVEPSITQPGSGIVVARGVRPR
jgi:16S rRNA (guanine527-N7)-methyltransferase